MAAFSDQFSRLNSLKFDSAGPFSAVISWLVTEAGTFLADLTGEQLNQIAQQLELLAVKSLPIGQSRIDSAMHDWDAVKDQLAPFELGVCVPFSAERWEVLATFSLWKLIDVHDLSESGDDPLIVPSVNVNIIMASTALMDAHRYAGQRLGNASAGVAAHESRMRKFQFRSSQSRDAVRLRWKDRDEDYALALSLIPKFKFKRRIEVARAIADEMQGKCKKTYGEERIDEWLKDSGWKATPGGGDTA